MASEDSAPAEAAGFPYSLGVIAKYDTLIKRSARRASYYLTGSSLMADDLAQDVRHHILRVLEVNRINEPAVVRRSITNALRDRIRFEQSRIQLTSPTACEFDARRITLAAVDSAVRPEVLSVTKWVGQLPGRLRAIFDHISRGLHAARSLHCARAEPAQNHSTKSGTSPARAGRIIHARGLILTARCRMSAGLGRLLATPTFAREGPTKTQPASKNAVGEKELKWHLQ
jgi:hypothetical protein